MNYDLTTTLNAFKVIYEEHYQYFIGVIETLQFDSLWRSFCSSNSIANILCHVIEMEKYWVEEGLQKKPFTRNRQIEFERHKDFDQSELTKLLQNRQKETVLILNNITKETFNKKRKFHGDFFTGDGILMWHIQHLALHKGQIQMILKSINDQ